MFNLIAYLEALRFLDIPNLKEKYYHNKFLFLWFYPLN